MSEKTRKIMRPGKTAKDARSGAARRNEENKSKRRDWENERDSRGNPTPFPLETCNGKKNRYSKVQKKKAA
jgi:hypothetical protein